MHPRNRRIGKRQVVDGLVLGVWTERRGRFGRRSMEVRDAEVVDLSVSGARLRVPSDIDLVRGQFLQIDMGRERGQIRVVDVAPDDSGVTTCRVEFVGAQPGFLRELTKWLGGRDLDPSRMRD